MKSSSFDTLKEMVEKVLMVYESQLQVMEFSKDSIHYLDRSVMNAALDAFKKYRAFLPELVARHTILKKELRSPQHLKDLEALKKDLDRLLSMDKQAMFLMENLTEHAPDQSWSKSDLGIMEMIFEHLNEKTGIDVDPKEMVKGMLALQKANPFQETNLENDWDEDGGDAEERDEEKQNAKNQEVKLKIQKLIQDLILEDIHPKQIQSFLLVQYIHMMSFLVSSNPEVYFYHQVANVADLVISLGKKIIFIEEILEDEGPSDQMKEVAEKATILRHALKERLRRSLTQKEERRQEERLSKEFFSLLRDVNGASIVFLASTFLYHWTSLATLESDVSGEYFQKLEQNWDTIFEIIYKDEMSKAL